MKSYEPFRPETSYPGRLSLAVLLWVGIMSTSESLNISRHTLALAQWTGRGLVEG